MKDRFKLGDEVFYMYYKKLPFKGIGRVISIYLLDNEEYIKVSFDDGKYDIKEFTSDGRFMKNLNKVLFHSEEECNKNKDSFSTPININPEETDKFKIFKALIEARDWYNEGWTPNWDRFSDSKSVLTVRSNEIEIEYSWFYLRTFYFKYYEIAQQFLYNYTLFLTQIKDLI